MLISPIDLAKLWLTRRLANSLSDTELHGWSWGAQTAGIITWLIGII